MSNRLAITVDGKHKVGDKVYITDGGVHRKVQNAYLTVDGKHRLAYTSGTKYRIEYGYEHETGGFVEYSDDIINEYFPNDPKSAYAGDAVEIIFEQFDGKNRTRPNEYIIRYPHKSEVGVYIDFYGVFKETDGIHDGVYVVNPATMSQDDTIVFTMPDENVVVLVSGLASGSGDELVEYYTVTVEPKNAAMYTETFQAGEYVYVTFGGELAADDIVEGIDGEIKYEDGEYRFYFDMPWKDFTLSYTHN